MTAVCRPHTTPCQACPPWKVMSSRQRCWPGSGPRPAVPEPRGLLWLVFHGQLSDPCKVYLLVKNKVRSPNFFFQRTNQFSQRCIQFLQINLMMPFNQMLDSHENLVHFWTPHPPA